MRVLEPALPLLLRGFAATSSRLAAAVELARSVGAEQLWVLVPDPRLEVLVPAQGFPPTLPGGPGWIRLLEACRARGEHRGAVEQHGGKEVPAWALVLEDGAAFIFLGQVEPGRLSDVRPLLGLVSALLRTEFRVFAAEGEAAAAQDATRHLRQLTEALDASRAEVEKLMQRQQTLHRIAGLLNDSQLDLDRIVQTLTDEATALVEAQFGAFFYTSHVGGASFQLYTLSGAPREAFERFGAPRATKLFGPAFSGERIIRLDDVREDPRYGQNPPHHGLPEGHLPVVSFLAAPVISRTGAVLGGLFFGHPERARFTEHHEQLLAGVASHAAAALDNAQLYLQARNGRRAAEQLALRRTQLQALTAALAQTTTQEEVANVAVGAAGDALGAMVAATLTVGPRAGTARLVASRGLSADVCARWREYPLDANLPLACALREASIVSIGTQALLQSRYPDFAPALGLRTEDLQAVVAVPFLLAGRAVGGVVYAFDRTVELTSHEREFLESFAAQCAQALERARLAEGEREAQRERERLIAELQATLHNNELFAGVLAHDLRNPLGAIMTSAQLVLARGENERIAKPLSRIFQSSQRMGRMIEQLLDFTRLRVGGGVSLQPQETDLREMCRQVLDELENLHPDWNMRLESVGNPVGVWDTDRLMQVVSNLAANAVHHGDVAGGLSVRMDGTRADEVLLRVHNQGCVPAALLPRLFEPFRGTQHRRPGSKGLGLGLFITRMLVTAHGGDVTVQSSEEEGTTFCVRLPRRTPRHGLSSTPEGHAPGASSVR